MSSKWLALVITGWLAAAAQVGAIAFGRFQAVDSKTGAPAISGGFARPGETVNRLLDDLDPAALAALS